MLNEIHLLSLIIIILVFSISPCFCSIGDRLPIYRNCYNNCLLTNCSNSYAIESFNSRQPFYMQLMGWDCREECKYECQWITIKQLLDSGLDYNQLPQFHGKWSFIRIFGIQEPASVLFSLINLWTNFYGWKTYKNSIKNDPYLHVWTFQTALAINAWFWSTIFHIHETPMTEKFDYFSAYSVVIYSLCALTIRVLDNQMMGKLNLMAQIAIAMPFLAFFLYHIHYLFYMNFDYGYNMKVNVITGVLSSIGWLLWSFTNRHKGKYIWKCVTSLILLNLLLLLEVNDFPPIGFIFDAHSLWHLGTIPIPLIWFSYLTDEANYTPDSQQNCDKKNNSIDCT